MDGTGFGETVASTNAGGDPDSDERLSNDGLATSPPSLEPNDASPEIKRQQSMTPEAQRCDSTCFASAEFALFNVSSPRRLGESLRSAASSHFPEAVDRIVRESSQRLQSQRRAAAALEADDDKSDTTLSEQLSAKSGPAEPQSSSAFLRSGGGPEASSGTVAMSTDSFATESSTAHNSSAVFSSTMPLTSTQQDGAATLPVRKKSFFAALLESKASTTPQSAPHLHTAATTSGNGTDAPRKAYRCKATFLGDSGSGKTTFQKCVSQSVLRTLPDAAPSTSSSSTMYYYRSETKREKLDLQVVDAGPFPLLCALTHIYEQANLFILVMSLAGVKQRTGKKFLSFGNEPSAIVHAQDKAMIRAYIASVCASIPLAAAGANTHAHRSPMLVVVGTHKDLLTDQSREAVETVLRELNRVVGHALKEVEQPPQLLGCFAVACSDHSCVPENRGGPKSIPELWSFLCDICLKEAAQTRALLGEAPIRFEDIQRCVGFQTPIQYEPPLVLSPPAASPVSHNAAACSVPFPSIAHDISAITERVVTFIRRAKTELNFVIVHMRALRQVAFSLGVYSHAHLDAILQMLSRDGEIMVLDQQPKHVGGREDSVVLWPHLAHRAVVTLTKYQRSNCYPPGERAALLPGVDIEECNKGDPQRSAITAAVFAPALLVALSKTLPQTRRPVVERAETFVLLLLLVDFVFQRQRLRGLVAAKRGAQHPPGADSPVDTDVAAKGGSARDLKLPGQQQNWYSDGAAEPLVSPRARANTVGGTVEPSPSISRGGEAQRCASSLSSTRHHHRRPTWGVEYIAPGLLNAKLPLQTGSFFDEVLLGAPANGGVLMGAYAATVVSRVLCIPNCPPEVFHRMVCRWGPFAVPQTNVYADAVWLRRVHLPDDDVVGQARGYGRSHGRAMGGDDGGSDGSCPDDDDSAADDMFGGGAHARGRRHTRCLAQAVWSEDAKDLAVRLTIVSTEELLVTAHFASTLLRVACHMLDCRYPGLVWSVQEGRRTRHSGPVADDCHPTDVVDIADVAELDDKFR